MEHEEIIKEVKMTYYELCKYLIQKYGPAEYNYFTKPECKYKNKKVSRTKEGLYCHHMDEDEGGNLSNPPQARIQPYEWQKKENLVYCNLIEHLLLHIKIDVLRQNGMIRLPYDIPRFFANGGLFWLTSELNDMYMNGGTETRWKKPCYEKIKENYGDYISLMKSLFHYIEINYAGDKSKPSILVPGSIVDLYDSATSLRKYKGEIMRIDPTMESCIVKLKSGEEKEIPLFRGLAIASEYTYSDYYEYKLRSACKGLDKFYDQIYEDILNCEKDEYSEYFKVDRNPPSVISKKYGFSKYASIPLDESFGTHNADEYISKALSMYNGKKIDLSGKAPEFWKDKHIPESAKKENCYYFVRFRCRFRIKEGFSPFVQIKDSICYRSHEKLESSMPTWEGKEYEELKIGETVYTGDVVLTMTQDEYRMFHEYYNVSREEILDGCTFMPA